MKFTVAIVLEVDEKGEQQLFRPEDDDAMRECCVENRLRELLVGEIEGDMGISVHRVD